MLVDEDAKMPGADAPVAERLLFLQENMVNFVKQYSLPVVEVALVVSKYIRALKGSLEDAAEASGEVLPASLGRARSTVLLRQSIPSLWTDCSVLWMKTGWISSIR